MSAVLDTHQCDPQHWLGHTLYSHPAYCITLIEQCVITMKGTVIGQFKYLVLESGKLKFALQLCGQNKQW